MVQIAETTSSASIFRPIITKKTPGIIYKTVKNATDTARRLFEYETLNRENPDLHYGGICDFYQNFHHVFCSANGRRS